ncbi:hypothetical protein CONCODRAFT_15116 [Conidiobolus coronatus NRRL 28638]|uniref:Zn(2)-C6 fungal-type domain-containing protein n=1 Tax=Conidiobolus coronatus (strain ATCC 28846 / CBS 209.66 / NRRL 28638) TaxID=796925 RepID=A0A137PGF9_CONC2|nr:hypothetical protein CONCODRAFT_15116 [Conidiobolus coronatus NRRL 28638]|eukprot:KXN74084.1 hypothetical protein CONCODRAFT_15116 [Conidiobolus coronatus NRRL 28638]
MEAELISSNKNSNSNNIDQNLIASESGISCDTCRRRHVRCGRQLPKCSWCLKSNVLCIYPKISRKRQSRQKFDNMSKIEFGKEDDGLRFFNSKNNNNSGNQAQKINKVNMLTMVSSNFKGSNYTFKIIPSISLNNQPGYMEVSGVISQDSINGIRFEPHLMLQLLSQITSNNPRMYTEVDWFVDKIKLGVYGGVVKSHIKLNNEWIKDLFNPSFKDTTLTNYFTYFHPWVTYFSKRLFYKNLDFIDPCLISVLLFVGYQYTSNLHQELLKYLEYQAKIQLTKNFNRANKSICQALFIFSYSMLFRGLAKQSLPYFNQACRISSILGIHLDIPGLSRIDQHERKCIRSMSICQDQHLKGTVSLPPYFGFIFPLISQMDPIIHIKHEESINELDLLEAECICLVRWLFDKYWMPATNIMLQFYLKCELKSNELTLENLRRFCNFLSSLFGICLINSCDKFLILHSKYNSPDHHPIIQRYVWFFTCMYHQWVLLIHSQQPPKFNKNTQQVDKRTQRCLSAAKSIFRVVKTSPVTTLTMYYHYLAAISFFYVKLYLNSADNEAFQEELLIDLGEVYALFLKFKIDYKFNNEGFDALTEMLKVLKIKF